jgi:hypothetical protein
MVLGCYIAEEVWNIMYLNDYKKNSLLYVCDNAFNIYYIVDSDMLLNNTEHIVWFAWQHF